MRRAQKKAPKPEVRRDGRFNKVWIIPIVALFLGIWLIQRNIAERGSLITITFENADGLKDGKTLIKCRNVEIGVIESIKLTDSLQVAVEARIQPQHTHLIREDSRFWVERPRIEGASISGLSTIISGAYIQLDPGIAKAGTRKFLGLETPPLTPRSVQGLRLTLAAKQPGAIDVGSQIFYNDHPIGKIESRRFNLETREVEFEVFIKNEFRSLVTEDSLFWESSGISLEIGADGLNLELPSLDTLLAGRVVLGHPDEALSGAALENGAIATLHKNREFAENTNFRGGVEFLLLLDQSLRGLKVGSPVEFRGLRVGRVGQISYNLVEEVDIERIPVLVQLNDRLMAKHFPASILDEGEEGFQSALKNGLRASLRPSNLITGQLYVSLDYHDDAQPFELHQKGRFVVIPTIDNGLENIQDQVAALLDKLNDLDLDLLLTKVGQTSDEATGVLSKINVAMSSSTGVVAEAQKTLKDISSAVTSLNVILSAEDTKRLNTDLRQTLAAVNKSLAPLSNDGVIYGDLRRTMDELRSAIRSVERMTTEIADKPNSLLFGKDPNSRKIPRARRR